MQYSGFRRILSVVGVSLFTLVASGMGSRAAGQQELAPTEVQEAHLKELREASAAPFEAKFDGETGRVKTLLGRFTAISPDRPSAARAFLARNARLFKLRADLRDLRLSRQVEDIGGTSLTFEQEHDGIPVFEGSVVVGFDPDGSIIHVRNEHIPDLTLATTPLLSPDQAVSIAESALGTEFSPGQATASLVVVRGDKGYQGHHLAWQISTVLRQPRGDWHLFVDARTGKVVRRLNLMKSTGSPCDGSCNPDTDCGKPFHSHPVDRLDDTELTDASDVDSAQSSCKLNNLTSATNLNGRWANTIRTQNRFGPPYLYLRSLNQPAVDEVTAYYHANRSKEYLNSLSFSGVMDFPISIDAHDPTLGDNAHYVPSGDYMEFGVGGVDDAQDPDVIYHELGHAIQDNQVPNYGTTDEGGATGEGFGDYWAAALTDEVFATSLGTECVAAWDAVSYNPYDGSVGSGCLRRVDGTKQYPRDFVWEVHDDGEIWSAALWNLRGKFAAAATADALVIKSHTFLSSNANFINAADALLSADSAMNKGVNASAIHDAMKAYGIPRTGTAASTSEVSSFVSFSCQSRHRYKNFEYKECRFTRSGAKRVRLRFSKFDTESGFDFVYISDADYKQVQKLSGKPFGSGAGFSAAVSGDTIVARFKADYSITKWGFAIDRVYYSTSQ